MSLTKTEAHVAVLPFPFASHPSRLFNLVKKLATSAPQVNFSFFCTPKFNKSLFANATTNNILRQDLSDGVPHGYVFAGKPMEDINLFLAVADEEFRRGVDKAVSDSGRRITCILVDSFMWFSCALAEELGVPWVPFRTAGACSLSAHLYTDVIRQTIGLGDGIEGRMNEKLNFIPGFKDLRLGDLPSGIVFGNLESPFSKMLHKMGQTLPRATVLPMNSFEDLDPDLMKDLKTKFKKILNVGPLNMTSVSLSYSDEYSCIPWLDKHHPGSVAYIGFGTMSLLPPDEIVALAEALETSGTPFLWSMKDDLKKHLPQGFVERTSEVGKFVAWAPQVQVLAHAAIGCFITHSGWGSVLESISAGVPLICRPFLGDQSINAWMVENVYKTGVRINGGVFTKNGAMDALEQVLLHETGEEFKKNSKALKELAFKAVAPNGSSTKNFSDLVEVISYSNS